MNRERTGQAVFAGTVALAALIYALTAPEGLPWNESTRLAEKCLGGLGGLGGIWGFYVAVFGGTVALSASLAALASGLLASVVNRYFGWRFAAASALVWTFLPWVWNRAITGERSVCLAAAFVGAAWTLNAVALWVLRKGLRNLRGLSGLRGLEDLKPDEMPNAKRQKVNRIAGWAALGLAGIFAVVSASFHDYRLGEAASVFARGVVESAERGESGEKGERGERIIVMNGVCDEQVVREVESRKEKVESRKEKGESKDSFLFVSLREDEGNRAALVAAAKREWPGETNLWMAAQVGAAAFVDAAIKAHPERFYLMNGKSTTLERWERRWAEFKPYAESSDPFAPAGRRLFGYEGNGIANGMQDGEKGERGESGEDGEKVKELGQGQERNVSSQTLKLSNSQTPQTSAAKAAWQLYKRIYEEIDPGNISALVNMSEMMRRGHAVGAQERKAVQAGLDAFFRDARKSRHVREIVRISGPVRADPEMMAQLAAEAKKRIAERIAAGEKLEVSTEVMTFVEWNNEMVRAAEGGDLEQAARLARKILSNPQWRQSASANALLGTALAKDGDYAASVAFFKTAVGTTNAVPVVVLNDYADTLMRLGDMDEAERLARRAVAASDEKYWLARLTLAQVLEKRVEKLVLTEVVEDGVAVERYVKIDGAEKIEGEIRALLMSVVKNAPANVRDVIRTEHRRFMR